MPPSAPCHIVPPRDPARHTHTIIFLHGRDSTNTEFAAELFESEASALHPNTTLPDLLPTVRWVFPAAPMLPSARFGTDAMSQWFDPEGPEEEEAVGLRASVDAVLEVLRREGAGGGDVRVFLAGISQGFATAVAVFRELCGSGERAEAAANLAGLIGLCGWMPRLGVLTGEDGAGSSISSRRRRPMPIFLGHCVDDAIVPVQSGRALRDELRRPPLGDRVEVVEWHEYADGGHWLNEPKGVDDVVDFVKRHL